MDLTVFENMPGVDFYLKCTFCTSRADGDLTVEVEPDMFVPLPICEACLVTESKNFNMIEGPVE